MTEPSPIADYAGTPLGAPWCFALDDTCQRRCADDCLYMEECRTAPETADDLYWERLQQWEENEAAEPLPPNGRSET